MATLTVRNIPDETLAAFRVRAAAHGKSMEAEMRDLIAKAAAERQASRPSAEDRVARAQAIVRQAFGGQMPGDLVDDLLSDRRTEAAKEA